MSLLLPSRAAAARRPEPEPEPESEAKSASVPDAAHHPDPTARHRRRGRLARWSDRLLRTVRLSADAGMATAEYAIVTVAAAAFAGLLIAVLRSDEVRGLLLGIIRGALSV